MPIQVTVNTIIVTCISAYMPMPNVHVLRSETLYLYILSLTESHIRLNANIKYIMLYYMEYYVLYSHVLSN